MSRVNIMLMTHATDSSHSCRSVPSPSTLSPPRTFCLLRCRNIPADRVPIQSDVWRSHMTSVWRIERALSEKVGKWNAEIDKESKGRTNNTVCLSRLPKAVFLRSVYGLK